MKTHLAVYRGISGDDNRYGRFVSNVQQDRGVKDWTATRKFSIGDLVLFYFSDPLKSIVAVGFVASELNTLKGHWDWTDRKQVTFCDYSPIWLLKKKIQLKEACRTFALKAWYGTTPYRHSHELKPHIARKLLSIITKANPEIQDRFRRLNIETSVHPRSRGERKSPAPQEFLEGGTRQVTTELQCRNPQLRAQALAMYGESCRVCGFNFADVYQELGAGYIEVHHLRPLSEKKSKRKVTVEDVDVVCANCHRVLHRNGRKPISLNKLRDAIKRRRSKAAY